MNLFLISILLLGSTGSLVSLVAAEPEQSPRVMVHLLDYIGIDYAGAVKDGAVISKTEYQEMVEFTKTLRDLNDQLPETKGVAGIAADLQRLEQLVASKADLEKIQKLSQDVKWKVIGVSGIELAPHRWPNLAAGEKRFAENCVQCHGVTGHGDGPASGNYQPPPSDFHDAEKMSNLSAFQAFNSIRLGVSGTAMASYGHLSDSETWDLAFYVQSMRYQAVEKSEVLPPGVSLQQAATLTDVQILAGLPGTAAEKQRALASIRTHGSRGEDLQSFVDLAKSNLGEVLVAYRSHNFDLAKQKALVAYLSGVEPIEPRIRANDPDHQHEIPHRMITVRSALEKREPTSGLELKVALALETLAKVESSLDKKTAPGMTFTLAAGIVLRESFEAIFLLIALLGVIRTTGSARAAWFVHLGWSSAVLVGVVLWFFSGWVMTISGAGRETLEGSVSLVAVGVVLYMGFWLHSKSQIGRWRVFLNDMAKMVLSGRSLFLLAAISFMAVFREAFETVLFLRAVLLESGGAHSHALLGGVISALLLVMILSVALVRFSAKLPVRQLFDISALVMLVLAFVLMGKAIHSFQEAGYLSITQFPLGVRSPLLGIYPSYESLLPQLFILVVSVVFWHQGKKKSVSAMA